MPRLAVIIVLAIAFLLGLWLVWPAKIDPAYWDTPPAPELTGPLEPRGRLGDAEEIGRGVIENSEDIAIDAQGRVYASQIDGRILRLTEIASGWTVETVAQPTELPALGLQWAPDGRLITAASDGLYAIDINTGEVETLLTELAGRPLGFADDLDISEDGIIYFTEASWKWNNLDGLGNFYYDMAENRPYGLFAAYNLNLGMVEVLKEDLYFANGVAMASDGRSVFVLETYRYRLSRFWLEGPQAGEWEIVDDNLPGIPDGLLSDGEGRLYIAMDTQRVPLIHFLHANPFITRLITKLPRSLWARGGRPKGFILVMSEEGEYLDSYHDPDGRFGFIANVVPAEDGTLWIGSLTEDVIGRYTPPR